MHVVLKINVRNLEIKMFVCHRSTGYFLHSDKGDPSWCPKVHDKAILSTVQLSNMGHHRFAYLFTFKVNLN